MFVVIVVFFDCLAYFFDVFVGVAVKEMFVVWVGVVVFVIFRRDFEFVFEVFVGDSGDVAPFFFNVFSVYVVVAEIIDVDIVVDIYVEVVAVCPHFVYVEVVVYLVSIFK